jgi:hypothetical protein
MPKRHNEWPRGKLWFPRDPPMPLRIAARLTATFKGSFPLSGSQLKDEAVLFFPESVSAFGPRH